MLGQLDLGSGNPAVRPRSLSLGSSLTSVVTADRCQQAIPSSFNMLFVILVDSLLCRQAGQFFYNKLLFNRLRLVLLR